MGTSKSTLPQEMAATASLAVEMAHSGIRVVRASWTEYDGIEFGVAAREDFDAACVLLDLYVGEIYGDVRRPSIGATGVATGQHIRVYGPADKR